MTIENHRRVLWATTLLVCTAVAAAQDFQLKVDVALVSVDVGVYDRKGDSITTLGKNDFVLYEDGVKQDIASMTMSHVAARQEVRDLVTALNLPPPASRGPSDGHATSPAMPAP